MKTRTTLFSWGYYGWGTSIPELLETTAAVEEARGFGPPMFVDVRIRRAVRAKGFRGPAFEEAAGADRYRWMKELGNPLVKDRSAGRRVDQPEAANDLIDLAMELAAENRRLMFFCSCKVPGSCHRRDVAREVIKHAKARDVPVAVEEWPGGAIQAREALTLDVTEKEFRAFIQRDTASLPVSDDLVLQASSMPWGSIIRVRCGEESALASAAPALHTVGRWAVPLVYYPNDWSARDLFKEMKAWRAEQDIELLKS